MNHAPRPRNVHGQHEFAFCWPQFSTAVEIDPSIPSQENRRCFWYCIFRNTQSLECTKLRTHSAQSKPQIPKSECSRVYLETKKVDIRPHGKGNLNSHGARPVDKITSMIKWIRTSRLSMKKSLSGFLPRNSHSEPQKQMDRSAKPTLWHGGNS